MTGVGVRAGTGAGVAAVADRYVDELASLDPCLATSMGVAGQEGRLTDFGPEAAHARTELARRTLREVDRTEVTGDAERVASRMLRERLATDIALADAGAHDTLLRTLDGPVQQVRTAVGLLDRGADTDWGAVSAQLRAIPGTLAGLRASLDDARRAGRVAPLRQVLRNAAECRDMRHDMAGLPGARAGTVPPGVPGAVATAADGALAAFAAYLADDLAADAPEHDALGADRYRMGVREFLGTALDLSETYAWGWDELGRVRREMRDAAARIAPDEPLPTVLAALDADPRHRVRDAVDFRDMIQDLVDGAVAALDGTHFTIPAPLRRIDCRITSTDGVACYLAPSEDLSRPGAVWWPLPGPDGPVPTWKVPSVMFHEGVPGHHLQLGTTTLNTGTLNRFQRLSSELHLGHCEGWGLYAERLMDELGHLDDPAHRLGMLAGGQQLRAARVVVDIGLHLQLPVPAGTGFHEGQRWTPPLAREFLSEFCGIGPRAFVEWEVDRYLGSPGQAVAYKIGERVWLGAREDARRRGGAAFDLRDFHRRALDLGPMGLDLLQAELTGGM